MGYHHCCHRHGGPMNGEGHECMKHIMPLAFMGVSMLAHAVMFKFIFKACIRKAKIEKTKMEEVRIENLKVDNLEIVNQRSPHQG